MGLLDDAIRDHIELKRRHGADPGEVARIETEALGPARREPVAAAPFDVGAHAGAATPSEPSGAATAEAPPPAQPDPPETAPAAPDEPVADVEHPAQPFDVEQTPAEDGSEATTDAEDEHREDVLEDTPEFLQETPEHERLWFDQKPPKDFDF